jgi:macrolide-specific efflux system membrane fusion protein
MYGKPFIDGLCFETVQCEGKPMNHQGAMNDFHPAAFGWLALGIAWLMSTPLLATEHSAAESPMAQSHLSESQPLVLDAVVLRPLQVAEVPAQQTGLLQRFAIREGEQVEAGQLLASLDDRAAQHDLRQAELEHELATLRVANEVHLRYAEKALEVARAELARSNESIEQFAKSISKSQLDVERLTVEKLLLEMEQARQKLELERIGQKLKDNALAAARLRLEQHQLRAPFAGMVALVRGQVGEWVEVGSPVLRLVAVERLRAEGFLSIDRLWKSDQAHQPLVGRPVKMLVTRPDAQTIECHGTLRFVSPEMDPVTRQVRIWAEIENDQQQLRPGQRGRLEIDRREERGMRSEERRAKSERLDE